MHLLRGRELTAAGAAGHLVDMSFDCILCEIFSKLTNEILGVTKSYQNITSRYLSLN